MDFRGVIFHFVFVFFFCSIVFCFSFVFDVFWNSQKKTLIQILLSWKSSWLQQDEMKDLPFTIMKYKKTT